MSLNGVSKHIRMLERADLVRRRRAGRDHFLSLNARPLDELAGWISEQRTLWTARLDTLEALLNAEDKASAAARAANRARKRPPPKRNRKPKK
jgi:DNA-binding transcriptional ArsR family regulator